MPASRTASAAPATSGTSGPMTTRSAPQPSAAAATVSGSATCTLSESAIARVPALPGPQARAVTAGSACRATHRACSRAPEPITSTRTSAKSTAEGPSAPHRSQARGGTLQGAAPGPLPPPRAVGRLVAQRAEEGAGAGVLGGSGTGVDPQQLAMRLGLQLAPGHQPCRVEPALVDGGGHRAAGFGAVRAVAEPAVEGEGRHVG